MKLIKFLALLCVGLGFVGCADEFTPPQKNDALRSRGIVSPSSSNSVTNPNLISDWEHQQVIVLNSSTVGNKVTVTAPWQTGCSSTLSEDFRTNIKKQYGWIMLFHTFRNYQEDVDQAYMGFYNLFTGMLKVFYYSNVSSTSTHSQWYICSNNIGRKSKLFDLPSFLALPDNIEANSSELYLINALPYGANGISKGWNGFEFQVPRYFESDFRDLVISISANDVTNATFNFSGLSSYKTNGVMTSLTTNNSSKIRTMANLFGDGATSVLDSLALKYADSVDKAAYDKFRKDQLNNMFDLLTKNNYVDAALGAAKLFFGKSLVKKPASTTLYTKSDIRLSTVGSTNLVGDMMENAQGVTEPITINLYDAISGFSSAASADNGVVYANADNSVTMTGLGVWTIKEAPKVYLNRFSQFTPSNIDATTEKNRIEYSGNVKLPTIQHCDIQVEFNPAIKRYITSSEISVDYALYTDLTKNEKPYVWLEDYHPYRIITSAYPQYYNNGLYSLQFFTEKSTNFTRFSNIVPQYNDDTKFYYDWGNMPGPKGLVAFVTVLMHINYEGKTFDVSETRAYEVKCVSEGTDADASRLQNPPYSVVINYGAPQYSY